MGDNQLKTHSSAPFSQSAASHHKKDCGGIASHNAADHCIIGVGEIAFAFVVLYHSMPCSERAFAFGFPSVGKFLSSPPSHAVENDACAVLVHLAVLVDDTSRAPRVMGGGATGLVALGVETLSVPGVLRAWLESSGLEEVE